MLTMIRGLARLQISFFKCLSKRKVKIEEFINDDYKH